MKKKDIKIFQLNHLYFKDSEDDMQTLIKTTLDEMELVKLIKVILYKASTMEETFAVSPREMKDLLLQYEGNRHFPNEEDSKTKDEYFDYIGIDLYNVWEACDVKVSDEDLDNPKYKNEIVEKMIKNYIAEDKYE